METQMKSTIFILLQLLSIIVIVVNAQSTNFESDEIIRQVVDSPEMYVDPLPKIPKIYGYSMKGNKATTCRPLTIGMYNTTWKFHRDLPPTPVFVYGTSAATATFPGPTIIARHGVPLSITWENHLPAKHILPFDPTIPTALPPSGVPTVVHLHGSANPPTSDGSAFAWFTANYQYKGPFWTQKTYRYPNAQAPGNLWYHDHALGLTRVNLLAGLIAAYVIEKPEIEEQMNLPRGEEFDQHLFIVDRIFNPDGTIYMNPVGINASIHPQWRPEYYGDTIVVNGKAWPYLNVVRRKYRFRIINASNARYYNLSLSNGLPFTVIGSDSSYLSAPVKVSSLLLSVAESADVIVDFSQSSTTTAELINDAPYPYPTGNATGPFNGKVMKFNIFPLTKNDPQDNSMIPQKLVPYASSNATGAPILSRYIVMYEYHDANENPTHLYINGKRLEDPATETPKSGTTELWYVINLTNDSHPLHLHLSMFQAVKVQEILNLQTFTECMKKFNDALTCNIEKLATGKILPVPEHEKTWKNVVKIEPGYLVSIVAAFKLVDINQTYPFDATVPPGYVYHCHILDHEDNAMIRPLMLTK